MGGRKVESVTALGIRQKFTKGSCCLLPAVFYSQKYYNRWRAFRTKTCLYHQRGVCRYGNKCRFLHGVKDSIKSHDISQIKSEMEQKMNEMNNLINSQALTILNQSSRLTDLQNCLDELKTQLSSLSDDFCQMKDCSNVPDKELTSSNLIKKPSAQIWEPPSLKKDTHFSTVHFRDGDLVQLLVQTSIGREWCDGVVQNDKTASGIKTKSLQGRFLIFLYPHGCMLPDASERGNKYKCTSDFQSSG